MKLWREVIGILDDSWDRRNEIGVGSLWSHLLLLVLLHLFIEFEQRFALLLSQLRMSVLQVSLEIGWLRKWLSAHIAVKRPLTGVRVRMALQFGRGDEALAAFRATVTQFGVLGVRLTLGRGRRNYKTPSLGFVGLLGGNKKKSRGSSQEKSRKKERKMWQEKKSERIINSTRQREEKYE